MIKNMALKILLIAQIMISIKAIPKLSNNRTMT